MKLPALVDVTCKEVTELVSDYLARPGMGARDRARLEQHMHACSWCMDYLQQLQMTTRAARQLASGPAPMPAPEAALLSLFQRAMPVKTGALQPPRHTPEKAPSRRTPLAVRYAFKFLDRSRFAPLSGFAWPEPGAWVETTRVEPCRAGIHACGLKQLAHWLHDSLWLVELAGDVQRSPGGVVASHGRLLHEVVDWREGGAARFAQAAYDHALEQAGRASPERRAAAMPCLDSAAHHIPRRSIALCAFCCAMATARAVGITHFEQSGYDAEKRWQSSWIARELGLPTLLAGRRS